MYPVYVTRDSFGSADAGVAGNSRRRKTRGGHRDARMIAPRQVTLARAERVGARRRAERERAVGGAPTYQIRMHGIRCAEKDDHRLVRFVGASRLWRILFHRARRPEHDNAANACFLRRATGAIRDARAARIGTRCVQRTPKARRADRRIPYESAAVLACTNDRRAVRWR